jgi:hypothetical protein
MHVIIYKSWKHHLAFSINCFVGFKFCFERLTTCSNNPGSFYRNGLYPGLVWIAGQCFGIYKQNIRVTWRKRENSYYFNRIIDLNSFHSQRIHSFCMRNYLIQNHVNRKRIVPSFTG